MMNRAYMLNTSGLQHYMSLHILEVSDPNQSMQRNRSEDLDELQQTCNLDEGTKVNYWVI